MRDFLSPHYEYYSGGPLSGSSSEDSPLFKKTNKSPLLRRDARHLFCGPLHSLPLLLQTSHLGTTTPLLPPPLLVSPQKICILAKSGCQAQGPLAERGPPGAGDFSL